MDRQNVVSARVSDRDRLAIDLAAGSRGVSRSSFLREAARDAAERELDQLRGFQERGHEDG